MGGASASGNVAIIKGYQLIRSGLADARPVVGPAAGLSSLELQGLYNLGTMGGKRFGNEPELACRPFDKDHEGFIYGQAAACLVLESRLSARQRGAAGLAEVLGGVLVLHGHRLPDPSEAWEIRAMASALNQAGIDAGKVDYINTHGTSTPLGDETEINAIREVFNDNVAKVWLNSTKGLTGHRPVFGRNRGGRCRDCPDARWIYSSQPQFGESH